MAVTHTFNQPIHQIKPVNGPETLQQLYKCKITDTGERLVHNASILYGSPIIEKSEVEKVIAINFPESEFERFCQNWEQYITIMTAVKQNPIARKQYEDLLIYSNLVK